MDAVRRPIRRAAAAMLCCTALVCTAAASQAIDYEQYYSRGVTFAEFLAKARSLRTEWRTHYNDAAVTPDMMTRMQALTGRRRILVVAEDWCSDSANTIPYIARLVDASPEHIEMRLINSKAGGRIMEAFPTPDGRAATPTVVVLDEDGRAVGAWTERPGPLRAWLDEQSRGAAKPPSHQTVHDRAATWYAQDAGKTTMAEIAEILAR